ncbi:putative membrane protein [Rhodopirellula maiorica SM1]|uniref:Putative membrane protein n=1 Tax=Rhodopirellula maiorica SM1 TaxID=1265738 RepID=M5R8I4_9BACT|nr:putative membrane protein [Rhodopirellula maiorica]EMI15351.1 putative membrane protein [Rhodopirellula maiorica SM1]
MRQKINESVGFLRSTAIGGIFFLLPLAVIGGLLGQVYGIVSAVAVPLQKWIPGNQPFSIAILFSAAVAILIMMCFAAGVIARRAIGKKFSSTVEKQLITVFPKYAIYKDLLAGNLKHDSDGPTLSPVLVSCPEGYRVAMEADRLPNGLVVVYFPGAPDTWIGSVVLVPASRVFATELDFNETLGVFERLGRDSSQFLAPIESLVSNTPAPSTVVADSPQVQ